MQNVSVTKFASFIFFSITWSFMEVLELELLYKLYADDLLLFETFKDFLEQILSLCWL